MSEYHFCLGFASCASCPIKLQDFSVTKITQLNESILNFLHERTIKGRKDLRVPFLVWCCWLCFLSSQIAGFFDHQYFCKESIDTVVFLHETVSGRKDLKLPFLFGCGKLGLLPNQTEEYSDHQQLWNESMNTLDFFCVEITIKRRNYSRVLHGPVRLMDSLIIYLSGRSQLLS